MNRERQIVIVGSGPIGATYARLLLESVPNARVTMIELGPQLTARPGVNVRNIADPTERSEARLASQGPQRGQGGGIVGIPAGTSIEGTYTARSGTHLVDIGGAKSSNTAQFPAAALSTCVGGQGAHWTCATPRPRDSERVKFIPDDEFDELLDRAEELLNTTHHAFDDSVSGRAVLDAVRAEWNDLPSGAKPEFLAIAGKTLPDGSIHWTGTDTVLGPLIEDGSEIAERFAIRAGTLVTRLIHSDGMVTGVSLRDQLSGHEETIQADAVVVAGDAIRTPQLLWASEIRPQALGRYLSDHPLVFSIVALDERIGKFAELAALQREQESRRERIDPVAAVVRIPFSDGANPFSGQVMYLDKSPIPLPPGMTPSPWGYANVGWGSRKFPRRENGLTFDPTELDYLGFPAVTFEYDMSPQELAEVEEAQRRLRRTAGALGEFIPGGEPRRMPAGASLHYKGTTRIGPEDDGTSVCDAWSRVWGFHNLYIGGNGVIPTATVVNPTLMSIAFAVRGARKLALSLTD